MSDANKALLIGFISGTAILGIAGFLLAPHLLALVGVGITHTSLLQISNIPIILSTSTAGVTAATFGYLQAGIAVLAGIVGGLAGALIGATSSKTESYPASERFAPLPSVTPITNEKAIGYAPSLGIDGQDIEKSHVKRYEQEKLASLQDPSQWRM